MLFTVQTLWGKKGLLHRYSKVDKHDGVLAPDKCPKVLKQYKQETARIYNVKK